MENRTFSTISSSGNGTTCNMKHRTTRSQQTIHSKQHHHRRRIIPDDVYQDKLHSIIQRDYFPSVPVLESRLLQLEEVEQTIQNDNNPNDGSASLQRQQYIVRRNSLDNGDDDTATTQLTSYNFDDTSTCCMSLHNGSTTKSITLNELHSTYISQSSESYNRHQQEESLRRNDKAFMSSSSMKIRSSNNNPLLPSEQHKQSTDSSNKFRTNQLFFVPEPLAPTTNVSVKKSYTEKSDDDSRRLMPPPQAIRTTSNKNDRTTSTTTKTNGKINKLIEPLATRFSDLHDSQKQRPTIEYSHHHLEGDGNSNINDDLYSITTNDTGIGTNLDEEPLPLHIEREQYKQYKAKELQTLLPMSSSSTLSTEYQSSSAFRTKATALNSHNNEYSKHIKLLADHDLPSYTIPTEPVREKAVVQIQQSIQKRKISIPASALTVHNKRTRISKKISSRLTYLETNKLSKLTPAAQSMLLMKLTTKQQQQQQRDGLVNHHDRIIGVGTASDLSVALRSQPFSSTSSKRNKK